MKFCLDGVPLVGLHTLFVWKTLKLFIFNALASHCGLIVTNVTFFLISHIYDKDIGSWNIWAAINISMSLDKNKSRCFARNERWVIYEYLRDFMVLEIIIFNTRDAYIFGELLYWSSLLVRQDINVMHVEKNLFDNISYMLINVKGKMNKDDTKGRKDITLYCDCLELELTDTVNCLLIPKTTYSISRENADFVCR